MSFNIKSKQKNFDFAANYNNQGSVISYQLDSDGLLNKIASHKFAFR